MRLDLDLVNFSGYFYEEAPLELGVVQLDDGQAKCLVCSKTYCNLYKAKRHYSEIHCVGLERCRICGAQFKNQRYRDEHMKRRHGVTKKMLQNMIIPK